VTLLAPLAACSPENVKDAQAAAADAAEQVALYESAIAKTVASLAAQDAQIEAMPPGAERRRAVAARAETTAGLASLQGALARTRAALDDLNAGLAAADTPEAALDAVGGAAQRHLPAPWGTLILAGCGLAGAAIQTVRQARTQRARDAAQDRERRTREAAHRAIQGVDPLIQQIRGTKALPEALVEYIRAAQGPDGQALVDEAQGKAPAEICGE